jgi:3-oxoisoapionate decarboxylase
MNRREVLALAGAAPAFFASVSDAAPAPENSLRMGGAPTAFWQRIQAGRASGQTFDILEHCHKLGLTGVQTNPPSTDPDAIRVFRTRIERYHMHLICDPQLPHQKSEVDAFEAQVKAYKEAGAVAFHAALTGRRYEDFDSFEAWKAMFEAVRASVELAEPVLRKHRVRLGIENHKGYRSAEQAAWLKRLGSEYVGVCFDFGNNLSLCEQPAETLRTLLPYIFFTHFKDMAVEDYDDGFLLSEVPLGRGILDLKEMVRLLRQKDTNMIFELEMITRDPLKIPVFTPQYWVTFDDSYSPLPGRDLARTLALVRKNKPRAALTRVEVLSSEARIRLEDENNLQCIDWVRQNLTF